MKYTEASINCFLSVLCFEIRGNNGFSTSLSSVGSLVPIRYQESSLSMKNLKQDTSSNGETASTRLRFKNLLQEEEEGIIHPQTWVDKWVEDLSHFPWPNHNHAKQNAKTGEDIALKGKAKVENTLKIRDKLLEKDPELKDSIISHLTLSRKEMLDDLELLPHKSPMFFDEDAIVKDLDIATATATTDTIINEPSNTATTGRKKNTRWGEKHRARNKHSEGIGTTPLSLLIEPLQMHIQRTSGEQAQLAVSIASTIETPQQWVEFNENVGGLKPILECIHNVAEEIKHGRATEIEFDQLLSQRTDIDKFITACSACKVLRDLISKDQYWASAITDDILKLNESGTIVADLVLLLSRANEAERIYTKKSWRQRRILRKQGKYSTVMKTRKERRDSKRRCRLYINQLLLGMAIASDESIKVFRNTPDLLETVRSFSSYTMDQKIRRRWIKYPFEVTKRIFKKLRRSGEEPSQTAFIAAASMKTGILGEIQATSNRLLAALGYNVFVPKTPGQRGLRILSLDGGGTRGVVSISVMKSIVDSLGGVEVCDSFDMIAGTSTGAIIAFLVGLKRESNEQAKQRYDELIEKIFIKSHLSTPMLLLTTATYSETPFKRVMQDVLGDYSMLDTRADPRVPLVFAVSAQMSSTTSKLSLFRNYNYARGEKKDNFLVSPDAAKRHLGFPLEEEDRICSKRVSSEIMGASRHEGSFRILQKAALRATTAAPTVFKPVQMGADMYSDGGLVASNPAAIAIHEARTLYPDLPIEMVVSVGTGEFVSEKVSPSFGWDGIISQIVKSATDTAKTHWVLQDILGQETTTNGGSSVCNTKYFRFDPIVGTAEEFPIDGTDPASLERLYKMSTDYMNEPAQKKSLEEIVRIVKGKRRIF